MLGNGAPGVKSKMSTFAQNSASKSERWSEVLRSNGEKGTQINTFGSILESSLRLRETFIRRFRWTGIK